MREYNGNFGNKVIGVGIGVVLRRRGEGYWIG